MIFLQERVGYRGRRFICFKFRTMKVGSDVELHRSHVAELMRSNEPMTKMDTKGDQRLIPLGSLLRATGLDELPQILNVLGGQMSLVGPRPCLVYEYENYSLSQRQRFNTLPGLTGLWQVCGKNKTTFSEMIALDIAYAEKKSLWLDLLILARTLPVVVSQYREARARRRQASRCVSETVFKADEKLPGPRCPHGPEKLRVNLTSADPRLRLRRIQKLLNSLLGSLLLGWFAFSPGPLSGAAPSYLLSEGFEGPGYENAGWSPSISTTAPDPDYTTPALVGTHSLRCNGASFIQRSFVRSDPFYCYFRARWQSWSDYKYVVDWLDANQSSTATLFTSYGNKLEIRHGLVSVPGSTVLSLNTTYHVWLEWTKGTGSDGTMKLFVSLDGTKPALPEASINTGNGVAIAFFDVGPFGAGTDAIYDQILIDDEVIGSSPGDPGNPGGNTPPTISSIASQTTPRNTPVGPITFSVGDAESSAVDLVVTGASSNPSLVPNSNIVFGGSGSDRTVTITPAADQIGLATITVTVSDGELARSATFDLTVTAPDGAPTYLLSEGFEGPGFENSGWFKVGTPNEDCTTEVLHGSQSLNCLGGQSIYRIFQNSNSFCLYFRARWNVKTDINNLIYLEDAAYGLVGYLQAADNFFRICHGTVFAAKAMPIAEHTTYHLWLEWSQGTGNDGTMKLFVSTNGNKPTTAAASLANGTGKATERMYIGANGGPGPDLVLDRILLDDVPIGSITDVDQPPVISDIPDQVVAQNTSTDQIPFTIGDAETAATSLSLNGSSSNPSLVSNENILFGGTGPNRTVTVTPAPNQSGTAVINVVVSDGRLTASDSFSLTVGERTVLTVTVDSATRVYGATNPDLTGNLAGLQNGDNITAIYTTTATAASPVGSYAIRPEISDPDGKLGHYTIATNLGTLTITPAALDVRADDKSRGYGAANPPLTGTITGIRNGDNITATYSTMATAANAVGIYAITPVLGGPEATLSNYALTLHDGTLTVSPAPLSISAHDKTRAFAAENPPLTGSVIGIQNGDEITATYTTTATRTSLPGNYPITPAASDPNNKLGNYRVSIRNGTLTVTLLPTALAAGLPLLEVTADDKTRVYGAANPALTGTITGLRNGDNITATYTTAATQASPTGIYPITPVLQDPSGMLLNYALSMRNGTLTITPGGGVRMDSISSPNDRVHLTGTGDANVTYTIQASSDLIQWTDIGSAAADSSGRVEFDEVDESNHGFRFYRARLHPE
jgi:lipopolysaccharide/colanic/teichoic acid biosynthesis glycosyltransferase